MSVVITNAFDHRIAAVYDEREKIEEARSLLKKRFNLDEKNIKILKPNESSVSAKLEGESAAIGKQMISDHFLYAFASFVFGMLVAVLLVGFGPAMFSNNPLFTFVALISPGIFMGVFYAGMRSLKPERDTINQAALKANNENNWTLLIDVEAVNVSKQKIVDEIKQTKALAMSA
ncbi:hypothetical protein ISG33_08450 [Glaciecola sp. MH2013]|uniref:hypothetical protein n=1 Tax=Glaciecola sp. MH2013 TaxID=2785524 RepID=UPI00189D2569|nr:hypothetical protein [Glaciecola sp. MH2013]MBF7073424.1 hypothetical protein [Glaciecola sp. MH2013]